MIGILGSESAANFAARLRAFLHGLKESGFVEGQNVAIEYLWADDKPDRLLDVAADLVRRQVAVNLLALADEVID